MTKYDPYDDPNIVEYEDDVIAVRDADGEIVYKGLVDFFEYKNDDWEYDPTSGTYYLRVNGLIFTIKKMI